MCTVVFNGARGMAVLLLLVFSVPVVVVLHLCGMHVVILVTIDRGLVLGFSVVRCSFVLGLVLWLFPSASTAALVSPPTSRSAGLNVGGEIGFLG